MDIQTIATVVAIIAGILTIIFGPKPLAELIKEWRKKRTNAPKSNSANLGNKIISVDEVNDNSNVVDNPSHHANPVTESFREMIQKGNYKEAEALAEIEREKLIRNLPLDVLDQTLEVNDFDVWHARALIYTGNTEDGLRKLNIVISSMEKEDNKDYEHRRFRKNLILGRAHNDRGYANWMFLGHYKVAIQEFESAIRYFSMHKKRGDQLATACDNLGRVYSQLGYRAKAELLVEYGRNIRVSLGSGKSDRYALSLISSAIINLTFGNPYYALELSNDAMKWLSEFNKRGKGLALIIQGQSNRYMGSLWTRRRAEDRNQSRHYLEASISSLKKAEIIFKDVVYEPIRLLQVYNEMGCTYREAARLEMTTRNEDDAIKKAELAHELLQRGLDIATKNKYDVAFVDGCEDLARLYKDYGEFDGSNSQGWLDKANKILSEAEQVIEDTSPDYFIRKNKPNKEILSESCIEDFWQHLGKIYTLKGHIFFDAGTKSGFFIRRDSQKTINRVMENYALAMGYFGYFLESVERNIDGRRISDTVLMNHRVFSEEVYWNLQNLDTATLLEINKTILPKIVGEYSLKTEWIDKFYKDVADLLIQTSNT